MKNVLIGAAAFCLVATVAPAQSDSWTTMMTSSWGMFAGGDLSDRLDDTGGTILRRSLDSNCYVYLWDVGTHELEIRKNGSRISDLSWSESAQVITYEGSFTGSQPAIHGTISLDGSNRIVVMLEDTTGPRIVKFIIDDNGFHLALSCVCSTAAGGFPSTPASCTTTKCDTADSCGAEGGGFYCNWRARSSSTCG